MAIDKGTFLLMTAALAGGGAAGYLVNEKHNDDLRARSEPTPPGEAPRVTAPRATPPATPVVDGAVSDGAVAAAAPDAGVAKEKEVATAPSCSDDVGTPAACPVDFPGPSEEGMCKGGVHWAGKRCADFKATMKPRVAQAAIDCLRTLQGASSCDAQRANACGHMALMSACQEQVPTTHASVTTATLSAAPEVAAPEGSVQAQCLAIVKAAVGSATSYADCVRTLSGMNELGRRNAVACMQSPSTNTLGLLGCEAIATPQPPRPIH